MSTNLRERGEGNTDVDQEHGRSEGTLDSQGTSCRLQVENMLKTETIPQEILPVLNTFRECPAEVEVTLHGSDLVGDTHECDRAGVSRRYLAVFVDQLRDETRGTLPIQLRQLVAFQQLDEVHLNG